MYHSNPHSSWSWAAKLPIIFWTTCKCARKTAWHLDVEVYWQENEWVYILFSLKWVEKILWKSVAGLDCFVLFLDNQTAQETDVYKGKVASLIGIVWYGLKNATDLWQVVDAGIGQMLKVIVGQDHWSW